MLNTVLKQKIELKLQELTVRFPQKALFVLKGISMELADPENATAVSLTKLLENRLGYFFGIATRRKIVTYEEFLLLSSFITDQYDTVCVLNNNLWMNQYPLDLRCSAEQIQGLLTHFSDPDNADDDQVIGPVDDLISLFKGVESSENGIIGGYCEEKLSDSSKIIFEDLFPETDHKIRKKETEDGWTDLLEERDYISLVQSLCVSEEERIIRTAGYTGDTAKLNARLRILAANCTGLYLLQPKTEIPSCEQREEYTQILRKYWAKDASFRDIPVYDMAKIEEGEKKVIQISQENIISDLVRQVENCAEKDRDFRDLFVTASTGSGKSAMFQIPAIYLAEKYHLMTIVVSPLISLMNDQISGLEKRGYNKAKTLNSDISPIVKEEIRQKVADGEIHILYLSPETLLARSDVEQLIGDRTIGMIVIDEAHIVTTWGKQFRPDYWYLGDHIRRLRKRQRENKGRSFVISTFTATAIYGGVEDMYTETINSLQMINPITYLGYVKRDDIDIVIDKTKKEKGEHKEYEPDKFAAIEDLVKRAVITGRKTLIYFPTVALIDRCYNYLYLDKMTAQVCRYNGAMTRDEKIESYNRFASGEKLVMLATKAFGMGVDIPDIEIVAHFAPTGNVCDYVQEIGRAARDPKLQGEAFYQYNTRDFKHINTLHGLSRIQEYQLVEVMRKIVELYDTNSNSSWENNTRKRNAMLLDAENFTYIFPSPLDDQDNSINKVKTALLMIQKDFVSRFGYSPINVRPIPLFEVGYFQVEPRTQQRLNSEYPDCLKEIDSRTHVCRIMLGKIWKSDPVCSKHSFPQYKYLLYSKSDKLPFNQNYTLIPALCVNIEPKKDGSSSYETILASVKAFVNRKIIDGKTARIEEMAEALTNETNLTTYKARTICEVIIASMETYRRRYSKSATPAITVQHDNSGTPRYSFSVSVNSFFAWLDRQYETIREQTNRDNELYLINDGGTLIQETATVLGVLEALDVLSFQMIGGANSQIYIYVNQIQTLRNILKNPARYRNRLLETVAERHTVSVKMLTYLYENDFTSKERWDLLEDYFLGRIPEEVKQEIEKTKA